LHLVNRFFLARAKKCAHSGPVKTLAALLAGIVYALAIAAWLGGAVAFFWSIFLAYAAKGVLAAIAMFLLPFLGQIVLAYICWPSDYSTLVVSVLGITALVSVLENFSD
jgi:hypothetical protein